jgi:sugar phosphate isomerase/epimerase
MHGFILLASRGLAYALRSRITSGQVNIMEKHPVPRRDFLKVAGASAAALSIPGTASAAAGPAENPSLAPDSKYPKLAIITQYSPQKLAFATQAGFEGVVVPLDDFFDPDKLKDSQIDEILKASRDSGARIISIECMWGMNHIDPDPGKRRVARERFIRCMEFAHRLGCKFTGMFSGATPGASEDDQVKALAEVINVHYIPVCQKLDMYIGPENYPCDQNFAVVPGIWEKLFDQVPDKRFGLEFDPSHLVRQYIDPYAAAWEFQDRIHAVHAKDTEITPAVLQKVGINGRGWWRYRIPGQGLIDWPRFITVLLQAGFKGGMAVEHEDGFWDAPPSNGAPEFPQERKDGFILAHRFLTMYLPGRLS